MIKKITAGDTSTYPFNNAFSSQERKVFAIIEQLRTTMTTLKRELKQTPKHAHAPAENYNPNKMGAIEDIETSLDNLEINLRWIPGGVYRYE